MQSTHIRTFAACSALQDLFVWFFITIRLKSGKDTMSGEILERNAVNHRISWFRKSGKDMHMQKIRGIWTAQSPSSFLLPHPPPLRPTNLLNIFFNPSSLYFSHSSLTCLPLLTVLLHYGGFFNNCTPKRCLHISVHFKTDAL